MLKDRGTIKWTSLMLPEHVELLKEMWRETEKVDKPILDPQELELMNEKLIKAYQEKLEIILTVYEDGLINKCKGMITNVNVPQNQLSIDLKDDVKKLIDFNDIIAVRIIK